MNRKVVYTISGIALSLAVILLAIVSYGFDKRVNRLETICDGIEAQLKVPELKVTVPITVPQGRTDASVGKDQLTFELELIKDAYPSIARALELLRKHESLDGKVMVGDGGRARGWLHQHEDHWREGCEQIKMSWKWPKDTSDLMKCEWVAIGYWARYAPFNLGGRELSDRDVEELIRRFRLPSAPYRADNDEYVRKVLQRD